MRQCCQSQGSAQKIESCCFGRDVRTTRRCRKQPRQKRSHQAREDLRRRFCWVARRSYAASIVRSRSVQRRRRTAFLRSADFGPIGWWTGRVRQGIITPAAQDQAVDFTCISQPLALTDQVTLQRISHVLKLPRHSPGRVGPQLQHCWELGLQVPQVPPQPSGPHWAAPQVGTQGGGGGGQAP